MDKPDMRLNAAAAAALAALVILGFIALPAFAATRIDVNVQLGGDPGIVWTHRPHLVVVPGTVVYWASDYADADIYRFGPWWYCFRGGYWYRASRHAGPWIGVDLRLVPRQVVYVPDRFHHFRHEVVVRQRQGRREDRREFREQRRQDRAVERAADRDARMSRRHGEERGDRGEHGEHGDHDGR